MSSIRKRLSAREYDRRLEAERIHRPVSLHFSRPERGVLTVTVEGVTYTATYYRSGGPGMRAYWTVQTSDRDYSEGNDWYEPSEARVRAAIAGVVAKRRG